MHCNLVRIFCSVVGIFGNLMVVSSVRNQDHLQVKITITMMLRTRMRMIEKDGKDDENDEDEDDGKVGAGEHNVDDVDDVDDVGAGEHNQPAVGQHLLL